MIKIPAPENSSSLTVEELVISSVSGLTQPQFKKLLKNKSIHINGSIANKKNLITPGDIIEVFIEDLFPELALHPSIIYEDENIIIYRKPAGVPCGYPLDNETTVLSSAEAHMRENQEYNPDILNIPYLITPLDDLTGGLVLIAKDDNIYSLLSVAIHQRRIRRFYTAVAASVPKHGSGELHNYMISSPKKEIYKIQDTPGNKAQPVVTRYKELSSHSDLSVIEVEPITDKPMQIQAQLAHINCPVLGDEILGDHSLNKRYGVWSDALWQTRLLFNVGKNDILAYLDGISFSCEADLPILPDDAK